MKEIATSDSAETRAYFVAVDHASRSVVVSIRGTYSFTDTMVDLLCKPVGEVLKSRLYLLGLRLTDLTVESHGSGRSPGVLPLSREYSTATVDAEKSTEAGEISAVLRHVHGARRQLL